MVQYCFARWRLSSLSVGVSKARSTLAFSNNVEATFDFVERTKFQRKTRSTLLPFLATKSNVASTLLLVWSVDRAEHSTASLQAAAPARQ